MRRRLGRRGKRDVPYPSGVLDTGRALDQSGNGRVSKESEDELDERGSGEEDAEGRGGGVRRGRSRETGAGMVRGQNVAVVSLVSAFLEANQHDPAA